MKKFLLCSIFLIAGCAGTNPADPYESYNRKVYAFNDTVDKAVLKPVAKGYKAVTPYRVRQGVGNVFNNLSEPKHMVHNLLQGKVEDSLISLHRFVFNSTFGLFGIFDLTESFKLPEEKANDMGTTLAFYGWKDSSYFLLPLLPPRTLRDQAGLVVDIVATDPLGYVIGSDGEIIAGAAGLVNQRAAILDSEKLGDQIAIDPYIFQRNAIMQYRQAQLKRRGIEVPNKSQADDEDGFSILDIARQNAE